MTALRLIGWALLLGAFAVSMAVTLVWLRWKIYAATYYATRALAQLTQRVHHWACRLPKEPPPPGKGGLYRGPIRLGLILQGPTVEEAGEAIREAFRKIGKGKEIDHPTD